MCERMIFIKYDTRMHVVGDLYNLITYSDEDISEQDLMDAAYKVHFPRARVMSCVRK